MYFNTFTESRHRTKNFFYSRWVFKWVNQWIRSSVFINTQSQSLTSKAFLENGQKNESKSCIWIDIGMVSWCSIANRWMCKKAKKALLLNPIFLKHIWDLWGSNISKYYLLLWSDPNTNESPIYKIQKNNLLRLQNIISSCFLVFQVLHCLAPKHLMGYRKHISILQKNVFFLFQNVPTQYPVIKHI